MIKIDKMKISNILLVGNFILIIINVIMIILSLTIVKKCQGVEFKFEYDQYLSHNVGATDTKMVYDIFTIIPDKVTDSLRFKTLNALALGYISHGWGHELFGHGYPLRRYKIPREYSLSLTPFVQHVHSDNNIINSQVYIGGLRFNKEYEDRFLKDGITESFDYRNSTIPFISKLIYINTLSNSNCYGNDIKNYVDNIKKINPKTEIENYLKESVYFSTFSPLFLINSWVLGKTFLTGNYTSCKLDYILTTNFNLYPEAVTRELGVSLRMPNEKYMRITYEGGQDIYSEKIYGFGFEYTNIPIWNIISADIKIHHVENCESDILLIVDIGHLYLKWKHQFKQYYDLEPGNMFSIGCQF